MKITIEPTTPADLEKMPNTLIIDKVVGLVLVGFQRQGKQIVPIPPQIQDRIGSIDRLSFQLDFAKSLILEHIQHPKSPIELPDPLTRLRNGPGMPSTGPNTPG